VTQSYQYLFGPVPSRRLDMSLGIDLVPKKVCSLNCVYCEVGKTTHLTTQRDEYIPYRGIIAELNDYFASSPAPDYITFSGYGEPTLNSKIGNIIQFIKETRPEIPIAVLTNGTLLSRKQVREELQNADVVLPSLDAATQKVFKKINVPLPGLDIHTYIQGLVDFRKEFAGKIWLEVFILPGYNDSPAELNELKKAFSKINPDRIHLNTLDRPGWHKNLKQATQVELQKIIDFWQLENAEIIAKAPERKKIQSYRKDIESAILSTIDRRPCTADDLAKIMGTHINEINKYLETLESEQKIEHVRQERGIFYQSK
jgi:wyosine [tRNA(Phe)-imidazoG37] synthetase (radical SAM superfamily)